MVGWLILIVGILFFISVMFAWFFLLGALKVHIVKKIPLSSDLFNLFHNHSLVTIYYTLAKGNKSAREENIKVTNLKSKKLANGYRTIIISLILLVIFILLIATYDWRISN